MQELEARRYRITGVLGKGGFGKVYRATLEGAGGFEKSVAIKLLRDEEVPELTLRRFRDEAKILGLVRDRAIVNVDPPTRLAGRWAVVMEYVDGSSLQQLLKLGPMPASVVAEVVQEIARVLDKVYRTPGPGGEPLRLLHRDIKPANLQVTPDGEVKILDFGIAKADFSSREAHTQAYVGGTKGFIAPERLEGRDGPAGDVFSLGVTAHLMIFGDRPTRRQMMGLEDPDTSELPADATSLVQLANRMRAVDPDTRPSAREVEEECGRIRRQSDGPSLRRWAEEHVPRANALEQGDEMVGSVLSETLAAALADSRERITRGQGFTGETPIVPVRQGPGRLAYALLALVLVAAVAMLGVSAGSAVLGGGVLLVGIGGDTPAPEAPGTVGSPELPRSTPAEVVVPPAPVVEPEPEEPADAAPAPAPSAPTPAPAPKPAEPVAPTPTPRPTAPASPKPADQAPTFVITFASSPLGADVVVDGRQVGQTPVMGVQLTEGDHTVKMVSDSETIVKHITVGRRAPNRYVWKGGETWEAHY